MEDDENDRLSTVTRRLAELWPGGRGSSEAEQLERLRLARAAYAETHDANEVVRILGWARRRGQKYEPAEVVYIYRRLVEPGPRLLLEGASLGERFYRILPPIEPVDAVRILKDYFGMQSAESARANLARYAKQLGVRVPLPPKPRG